MTLEKLKNHLHENKMNVLEKDKRKQREIL
jgi:hypothetical protein